jgi:integrase/recombinase XerC
MTGIIPMSSSTALALCAPVKHITLDDKNALKDAVTMWLSTRSHTDNREFVAKRDELLVEWLWHTGMRVSDALRVRFSDITSSDTVRFVVQKRSRSKPFVHEVSLSKGMLYDVMQFRERFRIQIAQRPDDRMFPVTRQNVDQRLAMYSKIANLPKTNAHRLRHGCAMNLLGQGVPPVEIAFRLAHSSVQVTEAVYARMNTTIEKSMIEDVRW